MPLYEYRCEDCGQAFEQLRRMQDADRGLVCPKCRSDRVERLMSTFASRMGSGAAAPCGAPDSRSCGTGPFR
jgi:putative FmdB family regulatory protein